jgi:hypothetical protein
MAKFLGLEEMNNNYRKMTHMGTMGRGFTVYHIYLGNVYVQTEHIYNDIKCYHKLQNHVYMWQNNLWDPIHKLTKEPFNVLWNIP